MRIPLVAAVASLVLTGCADAAQSRPFGTMTLRFETAAYATHFDPRTLQPVGPRVALEEYHDGWSFSPDGTKVAFGKSPAGGNSRDSVRIVDVASTTLKRTALTPAYIGPLGWLAPRALVGLLTDDLPVVFDPVTGATVKRLPALRTCASRATAVAGERMFALEPRGIVSITAAGAMRRERIAWIPRECFLAGLTLEPDGRTGWVASGSHLARIDAASMRVSTLRLHPTWRSLGPERTTVRRAAPGRLILGHQSRGGIPRGVELVDTHARSRKLLSRRAGEARTGRRRILTFNAGRPRGRGDGLRGFATDGRLRYSILRGHWIEDLEISGGRAYAFSGAHLWTVDIRRGRVVSRARRDRTVEIDLLEAPSH